MLGLAVDASRPPGAVSRLRPVARRAGRRTRGRRASNPPHNLVLARAREDSAIDALAQAVEDELPGVVGALPEVEQFARAWASRNDVTTATSNRPGGLRARTGGARGRRARSHASWRALPTDRCCWSGFSPSGWRRCPTPTRSVSRARSTTGSRRPTPESSLWEHEKPSRWPATAARRRTGSGSGRSTRRRSYADAVTPPRSWPSSRRRLLAGGRRFCFLYTDLANPTSNKIYERIGYVRVCESAEIEFVQTQTRK